MEIKLENSYQPKGKKILILCLKQGSKKDGIYFYAMDLIRELSIENNVTVVGNNDFKRNISSEISGRISYELIPTIKNKYLKWSYLIFSLPFILKEKLNSVDEIIFTTEDIPLASFSFFRPFLFNSLKINLVVHDLAEYFISRYSRNKDIYRRFIIKRLIKWSDRVITVSKKTKSDMINLELKSHEHIDVFYNQIKEVQRHEANRIVDAPYILYVSGFDYPSKNHLGFLPVFKRLKSSGVNYQLVYAGNADESSKNLEYIKSAIKNLELEKDIIIMTNVSSEDLHSLYMNCEFSVFPSLYEGFGRGIVESVLYGKKVYCNDVGIFRELSDHPLILPISEIERGEL